MKIESIQIKSYSRNLAAPWKTSKGEISDRCGFYVYINGDNDIIGCGEAAPLEGFSLESLVDVEKALYEAANNLKSKTIPDTFPDIASFVDTPIPSVQFALESACCDLLSKTEEKALSYWLTPDATDSIAVNFVAGDWSNIDNTLDAIKTGGYRAAKFKVGILPPDREIADLGKIISRLGSDFKIRLDANRAWAYSEALTFLKKLSGCNIEYIEEPLQEFNPKQLHQLKTETGIPIALDESLAGQDIDKILNQKPCDVIVLKPALIGGIYRTFQIVKKARKFGIKAVLTSLLETEIGLAAIIHLAAALGDNILTSGLGTIKVFEKSTLGIFKVENGCIKVPFDAAGIGINCNRFPNMAGL